MNIKVHIALFLFIFASSCGAYRILCFFPTTSKSAIIFVQPLLEALAEKGHEVTVVSQFPHGTKVKNYRDVVVPIDFGLASSK